jgi:hypothetical protein
LRFGVTRLQFVLVGAEFAFNTKVAVSADVVSGLGARVGALGVGEQMAIL